jgi:hypothetical protein
VSYILFDFAEDFVTLTLSILALLATFYQLYLQRIHNEKSVKPLLQIDLGDRKTQLFVRVQNNGLGPLIIDRLVFIKEGREFTALEDCLDLDPKSYMRTAVNETVSKVIVPGSYLTVFEKNIENLTEAEVDQIRDMLSAISLRVMGQDIYDNRIVLERSLDWFSRHQIQERFV